jgi:hypothetical protein
MRYEAYRELVFKNQEKLGILPEGAELSPINPYGDLKGPKGRPWPEQDTVRPWDSLSAEEQKLLSRMAEVYAGFVSHADHQLGRMLDYLEESGQLDNTLIVLVSDNGASGEGGPNGSVNENKYFNGVPDSTKDNLKYLDVLGSPLTHNHYPTGWAWAFNTPFKMWKRYSSYQGGTADPVIVSWPKQITQAVQILGTARPQLSKPRDRYVYYPGCAEVPESAAVNIRNRSYAISAEVTIATPEAAGVLFAHGARFGGHALYIKEGKLKYVYNWVGEFEQIVESSKPVPARDCVLSASFEKEGDAMPTEGTLSLYINDEKVAAQKIKTQPGKFSLAGEGLNVGKDAAEPVTDDYPGDSPWAFTGGTIHKVVVDVAGDPWVDLEKEVVAAFARD